MVNGQTGIDIGDAADRPRSRTSDVETYDDVHKSAGATVPELSSEPVAPRPPLVNSPRVVGSLEGFSVRCSPRMWPVYSRSVGFTWLLNCLWYHRRPSVA